jgi:hypothetical protein
MKTALKRPPRRMVGIRRRSSKTESVHSLDHQTLFFEFDRYLIADCKAGIFEPVAA